ncbi:MAG: protein-L-isoaspartate(D-aspartate) O-methyltransferase [Pseudomonadales bacterium]|nr:protein-L-isoaspartate(D-aspartate) O-methyltransferase [Pseudomonadales bacterium]NIX06840.1 protein-L-isoaspartate(D-aspartate) O-methyltransferase [Pseudomonadales bacterium]
MIRLEPKGLVACLLAGFLAFGSLAAVKAVEPDELLKRRLMAEIRTDARRTEAYTGRSALDERVMAVMEAVPRHEFVDSWTPDAAWENVPLPIGHGQTISQPFIVALMTDFVEPQAAHRVLEIGTGSGYQAAVLAGLVAEVYTVEIIPDLARTATQRLARLGYDNVFVHVGDGFYGWPDKGPFDSIVVTAVAPEIPPPLLEQLSPGGRMILPVGEVNGGQNLVLVTKDDEGDITTRDVLPVMFVPLTGDH